jgi:hypothetical protein
MTYRMHSDLLIPIHHEAPVSPTSRGIPIVGSLVLIQATRLHNPHCILFTLWPESASGLYRPSDRRLSAKLVPTFSDRGYCVVSTTDPYGRILGFLDRRCYFLLQAAHQLYSRGRVDPVSDPLLLRKSGSAGNRTLTS